MSQSFATDAEQESNTVQLLIAVETKRRGRQEACVRFLRDLPPLLDAARKVDRELDFHIAHRFNALRYLRYDELGLSKIIADLLDPSGDHGQGNTYLEAMLELLSVDPEGSFTNLARSERTHLPTIDDIAHVRVEVERTFDLKQMDIPEETETQSRLRKRRIDILADIQPKRGGVPFGLAFENKPYAHDLYDQCKDYLEFLADEYARNFLLVYIPPIKRMPKGLDLSDLSSYREHFRVLPYVSDSWSLDDEHFPDMTEATNGDGNLISNHLESETLNQEPPQFFVGDDASLANWFGICKQRTNAERLRWFLSEAQLFCQQHFGSSSMIDSEVRYINEYLEDHPEHAPAAYAVARAWPEYMHDVCSAFLTLIAEKVREDPRCKNLNLKVVSRYEKRSWGQTISIYRDSWTQYEGNPEKHHSGLRTAIYLENPEDQTQSIWGIRRPKPLNQMNEDERSQQNQLAERLKKQALSITEDHSLYLQYDRPPKKYRRWAEVVGELAKEIDAKEGEVTRYFVDQLCDLIDRAVCAIDDVEST